MAAGEAGTLRIDTGAHRMPSTSTAVTGADLDLVELALLPHGLRLQVDGAPLELTDAEGTPVARVDADGRAEALRPLAARPELRVPGTVPLTDPALREAVAAVAFDALPTRTQVAAVAGIAPDGPVAWLALSGRGRRGTPAGALLRAVAAAAAAWSARTGRQAPVAAVPWSLDARPSVLRAPALADADGLAGHLSDALGLDEVVVLGEGEEHHALAHLEGDAAGAARALYPAEVLPFHRDERREGRVVLFTGLSGSGKSTIAKAVAARLDDRPVTLLDGDEVRRLLSSGLGFDAEGRAVNVRRIGWVAAEVAKAGGTAIAAPIAPFAAGRAEVRAMAEAAGVPFLLVHVSTSLAVCEARDRKGLYAAARAGEVAEFTGISSPYEEPVDADLRVDAGEVAVEDAVELVLDALEGVG